MANGDARYDPVAEVLGTQAWTLLRRDIRKLVEILRKEYQINEPGFFAEDAAIGQPRFFALDSLAAHPSNWPPAMVERLLAIRKEKKDNDIFLGDFPEFHDCVDAALKRIGAGNRDIIETRLKTLLEEGFDPNGISDAVKAAFEKEPAPSCDGVDLAKNPFDKWPDGLRGDVINRLRQGDAFADAMAFALENQKAAGMKVEPAESTETEKKAADAAAETPAPDMAAIAKAIGKSKVRLTLQNGGRAPALSYDGVDLLNTPFDKWPDDLRAMVLDEMTHRQADDVLNEVFQSLASKQQPQAPDRDAEPTLIGTVRNVFASVGALVSAGANSLTEKLQGMHFKPQDPGEWVKSRSTQAWFDQTVREAMRQTEAIEETVASIRETIRNQGPVNIDEAEQKVGAMLNNLQDKIADVAAAAAAWRSSADDMDVDFAERMDKRVQDAVGNLGKRLRSLEQSMEGAGLNSSQMKALQEKIADALNNIIERMRRWFHQVVENDAAGRASHSPGPAG